MLCPICKRTSFDPHTLAGGLTVLRCASCRGDWIPGTPYWNWVLGVQAAPAAPAPNSNAPAEPPHDIKSAKLCPECGKFLHRFEIGQGVEFSLDHCATCGGFWFDANELQSVIDHNLHTKLHLIIAADWQARLAKQRHAAAHEQLLREHLGGADLAQAHKVKVWLDSHPRRAEILAYLIGEEFRPAP